MTPTAASPGETFTPGVPGFSWPDLHDARRLRDLGEVFHAGVAAVDTDLASRWRAYTATPDALGRPGEAELLLRMGPHLEAFVATLFGIEAEVESLRGQLQSWDPLVRLRDFASRRVWKRSAATSEPGPAADGVLDTLVAAADPGSAPGGDPVAPDDPELRTARALGWLVDAGKALERARGRRDPRPVPPEIRDGLYALHGRLPHAGVASGLVPAGLDLADDGACLAWVESLLDAAADGLLRRLQAGAGTSHTGGTWVSLRRPGDVDPKDLVPLSRPEPHLPEVAEGPVGDRRLRDGFVLTDRRWDRRHQAAEVNYCLYCHERSKDSCSRGFTDPETGAQRKNALGIPLQGCPLDERISEAHLLRSRGLAVAALAVICVDNPMLPGTGHRICNDCMKACIFQKQEPVNIPQLETGILTEVLALPYGFEVWSLLARWNPLRVRRPHPRPYRGLNVLVVGLGPAGYTLAQYLLDEGFGVVGVDGLKLEPLPEAWAPPGGGPGAPIRSYEAIRKDLDERFGMGFGGVSEYGITVRWDKNFLTLLYLNLARRTHFRAYGGIRFGGTVTLEEAWELGFHHVAIATGAGRPTLLDMKGNLLAGIRKASDFLMGLQLTGAFRRESLANLQAELPAVVIGGGLTAIDTATELLAYYPVQVEKVLHQYEERVARSGEEAALGGFTPAERTTLSTFLEHGRAVRDERLRARLEGRPPDLQALCRAWGGVTIAYRRTLAESPAYRLNHEEVIKAFEEGIRFAECLSPVEAVPDAVGHVDALRLERQALVDGRLKGTGEIVTLPARTVYVAAGTAPNTIYEREWPGHFEMDRKGYFVRHVAVPTRDGSWDLRPASAGESAFLTSFIGPHGELVSFYGDNHPDYSGNVVKAMASARDGHRTVVALFEGTHAGRPGPEADARWRELVDRLDREWLAVVDHVTRLTETIVEVVVRAPAAARRFRPGQFFRLQDYESDAPVLDGVRVAMEGLALTGAGTVPDEGLLSLIVLEMGASSRLCATLRPGQRVVVMGPTGEPTEIPAGKTIALVGGGLGNAVLFSIARALRETGNRVLYFAGYKRAADLFKREEIEASTDQVIWAVDQGPAIHPTRTQDRTFVGNIVQAMLAYAHGELSPTAFPFCDVDRVIAIGSDRMMDAVRRARHHELAEELRKDHVAIGSINSPMQCMMKEICAQCLQNHVDPETGEPAGVVFTCFNQDQPLDAVDFDHLRLRLSQNTIQEKLADDWVRSRIASGALRAI